MNLHGNGHQHSNNFAQEDNEIKKYLRILNKRKWLIIIIFLVVSAAWVTYVVFYESKPIYTTKALLHFQDAKKLGEIDGQGGRKVNESRVTTLTTNKLLGMVVQELQLTLSILTPDVSRSNLFEYVDVNKNSIAGIYRIRKNEAGNFNLYYSNLELKIEDKFLLSFQSQDTVKANKIKFLLNYDYVLLSSHENLEFMIRNVDRAINSLRSKIAYSWLDRKSKTYLEISATSASPKMAATIANMLAKRFVELDLEIKNRKTNKTIENLWEQLESTEAELTIANQKLQRFKEQNPGLTEDPTMSSISNFEQNKSEIQLKINDLTGLLSQLSESTTFGDSLANTRQLLTYLISENVPEATALEMEFSELVTERNGLLGQYAPTHPIIISNQKRINAIQPKVLSEGNEYISKLDGRVSNYNRQINRESQKLISLPRKQRVLSELASNQRVKQDVYETILRKYNQAKLNLEVGDVGDVFILDEARVPPLQGSLSIIINKSLLGLAIGLALGLGLAIVLEFFDKTVQTPEDLEYRVKLPVIGSIPVIHSDEAVPGNIQDVKGKRDTKLITMDYSPTLESESYRDLRTKLLFMNRSKDLSSFLMTSLRPNEGKSLTSANLAITFAQQKISTLLVDADLRRGVLHNVFGNRKKPGLGDFLISKATIDYENVSKLVQKTIIPNLYMVTTGSPIPNPTEMLGSERMISLLNIFKSRFGMVILDTAPLQASSDAAILSTVMGGAVIVVRAEYTNVEHLNQKLREYPNMQDNVLGLILNMVKTDLKKEKYQYTYYNY
mgnify:CR=1 FL=1